MKTEQKLFRRFIIKTWFVVEVIYKLQIFVMNINTMVRKNDMCLMDL